MARAVEHEDEEITIQRRIKEAMRTYREFRGWNQQRMAEFVGTSKAKYQKYEIDDVKRRVPISIFMRFCENTGKSMEEVARGPIRRRA